MICSHVLLPLSLAVGITRVVALPMLRTLYESRFDLELWASSSRGRHWQNLSDRLWAQHLPYGRFANDQWPCSALSMFGSRGIPGLRYTEVWRQLIAFDALEAFTEAAIADEVVTKQPSQQATSEWPMPDKVRPHLLLLRFGC